jgi:hypothetical protein
LHNGAYKDFYSLRIIIRLIKTISLEKAERVKCLGQNTLLGNVAGRGPSGVNGSRVQIGCALVHMSLETLAFDKVEN